MKTSKSAFFVLCVALPLFSVAACAKEKPLQVSKENFVSLSWSRVEVVRVVPDSSIFSQGTLPDHHTLASSYTFKNQSLQYNQPESFDAKIGGVGGGFGGGFPNYGPPSPPVPMSQNQWEELLARLKTLNLPSIASHYEQKGLTEGVSETLTLTISEADNVDRTIVASTSDDTALISYTKFMDYLSTLITRKFPFHPGVKAATSPAPVAPK